MHELSRMSGSGGCQLINAAGTYAVAAGTLIRGAVAIQVVTGAAAAISALSTQAEGKTAVALPDLNNIVGEDLSAINGNLITFAHPISTLTVAANVVLIVYGG